MSNTDTPRTDTNPQPPSTIWLQWYGDQEPEDGEPHEVSWCGEKIFEHDIEYVRASENAQLAARISELEAALARKMELLKVRVKQLADWKSHADDLTDKLARSERELAEAKKWEARSS